MKRAIVCAICCIVLGTFAPVYAADTQDAAQFSSDYGQEVKETINEPSHWEIAVAFRPGVAVYTEGEESTESSYKTFFPQVLFTAKNRNDNDIEHQVDFSYGQSISANEDWYLDEATSQANKLSFHRLAVRGTVGKVLHTERMPGLELIPFMGYGYRRYGFKRTAFTVYNAIPSVPIVSKNDYVQFGNLGLKFAKSLNEQFDISGAWSYGYVFDHVTDNSELGRMQCSDGGHILDGSVRICYALHKSFKLSLGGFSEFQKLKGITRGNKILFDNELTVFGAEFGARFVF